MCSAFRGSTSWFVFSAGLLAPELTLKLDVLESLIGCCPEPWESVIGWISVDDETEVLVGGEEREDNLLGDEDVVAMVTAVVEIPEDELE